MNWLIKKILFDYLKSALDKLPLNGAKTIVGLILIICGEVLKAYPSPILQQFFEFLKQLPYDPITDMGIITLLTGLVHKVLKYFNKG